MAAVVPEGQVVWGLQLPVQSQSTRYVEGWETGPDAGPSALAAVATAADRAGAFYVAVCDHVAIPDDEVEAMGSTWYDTMTTLGWLAARTERVRLLSHVAVLPYRHPLVTAKAWCTLDALSGGRAVLGVGAGHVRDEFERPVLDGPTWPVAGVAVAPRPVQPGGPPVWVGGSSPAALRRVVERGDGWLPQGPPPQGMRAALAELRQRTAEARPGDRLDLGANAAPMFIGDPGEDLGQHTVVGPPEQVAAGLARLLAIDVDHVQVRLRSRSAAEAVEQVERFGAEVWPAACAAAGRTSPATGAP